MKIGSRFRCLTCQINLIDTETGLTQEAMIIIHDHLTLYPEHEIGQRFYHIVEPGDEIPQETP